MALDLVEMTHPNLPGQPVRVPRQSVPHHQRAGWQLAPETPPDPPPTTEPTTEAPATAGASALPESPKRRRTRGDE